MEVKKTNIKKPETYSNLCNAMLVYCDLKCKEVKDRRLYYGILNDIIMEAE